MQPRDFNCVFYVLYRSSAERFATERVTDMVRGRKGEQSRTERLNEGSRESEGRRKRQSEDNCVPVQTCFHLPADPTVTHMEGLVLGSENVGSINPVIVALIGQPQSISLFKLAVDQKLLVGSQQNQ